MLTFYKDAALTRPVTASSPVWVFSPPEGTTRRLSLWLADAYAGQVAEAATAGDVALKLIDSVAFPASGQVVVNGTEIAYTANHTGVLTTGSLPVNIAAGSLVYLVQTYSGSSDLAFYASQSCGLKLASQMEYSTNPLVTAISSAPATALGGPLALVQVDVQVTIPAGDAVEITDLKITATPLQSSAFTSSWQSAVALFQIERADQSLSQRFRIFPAGQIVQKNLPGFVLGQYRWRNQDEVNAQTVSPSRWDLDVRQIGLEKFLAGIGHGDDLEPLSLQQVGHSIQPVVKSGAYFTGPNRYFMPSDDAIVLQVPLNSPLSIELPSTPRAQRPIYVGMLRIDSEGYYDDYIRYDRRNGAFDDDGTYQFQLHRQTITLNQGFPLNRMYLGVVSATGQMTCDLPYVPVAGVTRITMGAYGALPEQPVTGFTVDYTAGTVTIQIDNPDINADRDLYVYCQPAVLVIYEQELPQQRESLLLPVELNPAFSGLTSGFLYLEHRKRRTTVVQLSCDKPRIVTPQQYAMVAGLVTFGPVFYENDFALLQAKALSEVSGEAVPGVQLKVSVSLPFNGLINYQDPTAAPVVVTTGGDGIASLLYTPDSAFGVYLAPIGVQGTDFVLPSPVPLQELWNTNDGWLVRAYAVYDNDPFFGMTGADRNYGEIPWQTTGEAGTVSYKTNGKRVLLSSGSAPLLPVTALDAQGKLYTDPAFSGSVAKLRYASALPAGGSIGAYFIAYVGRILVQVQALDSGILSNQILLDLETPPVIVDDSGVAGYLVVGDSGSGRLNQNRLGGAPVLPLNVNISRY